MITLRGRIILCVSIVLCHTAGAAIAERLNASCSLSTLVDHGFTVTGAYAVLEGDGAAGRVSLAIAGDTATGVIEHVEPGWYRLTFELYDGKGLLVSGEGEGAVNAGSDATISGRVLSGFRKWTLIVNWRGEAGLAGCDFLGYRLDEDTYIKTYRLDLAAFESFVDEYRNNNLIFLTHSPAWDALDENKIPYFVHSDSTRHRNPVQIMHTAFGFYHFYTLWRNADNYRGFMANLQWIMAHRDEQHYLQYDYVFEHTAEIDIEPPWISAMAQGEALTLMCKAFHLTGDSLYLDEAAGYFDTLVNNTGDRWCFMVDDDDYYWMEEYPNDDICHVLNGKLIAMRCFLDYYVVTGNEFAKKLFLACLRTIADHYPIWNFKGIDGSKYCLHYDFVVPRYHQIHLDLFEVYDGYFSIPEFRDAIELYRYEEQPSIEQETEFSLMQNAPNPFNHTTTIPFNISDSGHVILTIYDSLGRHVITLQDEWLYPGQYRLQWDGRDEAGMVAASGVYFYEFVQGSIHDARSMVLVK